MVRTGTTVIKNTIWLSLGEIISKGLMFFLTIYIARSLGDVVFGQYSYIIAFVSIFLFLPDFGISRYITRELARQKELTPTYVQKLLPLKILLSLGTIGVIIIATFIVGKSADISRLTSWAGLYIIFLSFSQFLWGVFRAHEKMHFEAILNIVERVILLGVSLWIILGPFENKLAGIIYAYIIANASIFLINLIITRKYYTKLRLVIDGPFWKSILKQSWPFALSAVFITIYYNLGSVMLSYYKSDEVVGWYNAAYRIIFFILLFVNNISSAVFPALSRLFVESKDKLENFLREYSKIMVILALPLAVGGTLFAQKIIKLIYGDQYLNGVLAFQILIWSAVVIFISTIYGNTLQAADRQKIYVKGVGLGAIVNILVNLIAIPRFSLEGAAFTALLSEIVVFIYMYFQVKKFAQARYLIHAPKPIIAAGLMLIVLLILNNLHVLILIPLGALIYFAALMILGGVNKSDWQLIKQVFKRRTDET